MLFNTIYFCWFLSEVLLNRLMRSGKANQKNTDRGSLALIWIVVIVSMFVAVWVRATTDFIFSSNENIAYVGVSLIILGMIFRFLAIRQLGRMFTVDVAIVDNHAIMKEGFYKVLRHPSYAGSLLSFVGFGISQNNYLSLVIVIVPVTLSFLYRIHIEEKTLVAQFGDAYLEYRKTTKALIPFII